MSERSIKTYIDEVERGPQSEIVLFLQKEWEIKASVAFGIFVLILYFLKGEGYPSSIAILVQTALMIILSLGIFIFMYNAGYLVILLALEEDLSDMEEGWVRGMIRKTLLILVGWGGLVISSFVIFPDVVLLTSFNSFVLAGLLKIVHGRGGHSPFSEEL